VRELVSGLVTKDSQVAGERERGRTSEKAVLENESGKASPSPALRALSGDP